MRMYISDSLSIHFRAADESLDFSLSLLVSSDPSNCPCRIWSASTQLRLAMEKVARDEAQQGGYPSESESRLLCWSGHRHPVIIRRALLNGDETNVNATRPQWCAILCSKVNQS